ncbi:nucleoid-associated protein [Actinomadura keratinilytica]
MSTGAFHLKGFTRTRCSGRKERVTISFDAELINQRVIWDEMGDNLTIKGLPPTVTRSITALAERPELIWQSH